MRGMHWTLSGTNVCFVGVVVPRYDKKEQEDVVDDDSNEEMLVHFAGQKAKWAQHGSYSESTLAQRHARVGVSPLPKTRN